MTQQPKISRENSRLAEAYLDAQMKRRNITQKTRETFHGCNAIFLEWAGTKDLLNPKTWDCLLPDFLCDYVSARTGNKLSYSYIRHVLEYARGFFEWLPSYVPRAKRIVSASFLNDFWLSADQNRSYWGQEKQIAVVPVEAIIELAKIKVTQTTEQRIQAAAIMLFLSGQRIEAFMSTPLRAIDWSKFVVHQTSQYKVRTKNLHPHTTQLIRKHPKLHEAIEVVRRWYNKVHVCTAGKGHFFAKLDSVTGEIVEAGGEVKHGDAIFRKGYRQFAAKYGLQYYHPHAFRHGYAIFFIDKCENILHLVALQKSLGHKHLSTLQHYSHLSETNIHKAFDEMMSDNDDVETQDE